MANSSTLTIIQDSEAYFTAIAITSTITNNYKQCLSVALDRWPLVTPLKGSGAYFDEYNILNMFPASLLNVAKSKMFVPININNEKAF